MKHLLIFVIISVWTCLSGTRLVAATIEVYGDSITAGLLSHTNVTRVTSLSDVSDIISNMVLYKITENPTYLEPHHAPGLTWAAQLARLLTVDTNPVALDNRAVSGSRTKDLLKQMKSASTKDRNATAYFFIGHNDLCKNTQPPEVIAKDYVTEYEKALLEWNRTHEQTTAYLLPVGDIHRAYEVLDGYVWAREERAFTCNDNWRKYFPYCTFFYGLHKKGKLSDFLVPRIEAMNSALASLAEEWNAKGSTNRFLYLENLHTTDYVPSYFALDCYHLSEEGQATIANAVYGSL